MLILGDCSGGTDTVCFRVSFCDNSNFGSSSLRIGGLLIGRELCADEDTDCSFLVCPLNIREGEMDSITSTSSPRSTKSSSSSTEAWCCRGKLKRRMVFSPFLIRTNRPDSGISSPPEVRKGMNLIPEQTDRQKDRWIDRKL